MLHFYDGQIRRYLVQTIRVLSNFAVKYGDNTLHRVPVMYGDSDRQTANILKQNSENKINSVPRISVYVSGLELDRSRLSDSTYVGKLHFRERDITNPDDLNNATYNSNQGKNYTVERLMPTPFKLTMKCDIWAANADQKLQILEQILVLFNPSLELQTTDNYIDWTSLTVLELANMSWSSKTVPVGNDSPIDVATLTFETPIWISPPTKVKHLGVITNIVTSIYESSGIVEDKYIDGLGIPLGEGSISLSQALSTDTVSISGYNIQVYNRQAVLLGRHENVVSGGKGATFDIVTVGTAPDTSYSVVVRNGGQGYGIGNILTVSMGAIGGKEDSSLLIEVTGTDSNSVGIKPGSITSVVVRGVSPGGDLTYTDVPSTIVSIGDSELVLDVPVRQSSDLFWSELFDAHPGLYKEGSSRIFLKQPDGSEVIGTVALFPGDNTILQINWDYDTYTRDDLLQSYNGYDSVRSAKGNFDAIIDPTMRGPRGSGLVDPTYGTEELGAGTRYLLVNDIGDTINQDGPDAWKNNDGSDFIAHANDIIEWDGDTWHIIFNSQDDGQHVYQTNIYSGVQYVWNNVAWARSVDGEYGAGKWRIEL